MLWTALRDCRLLLSCQLIWSIRRYFDPLSLRTYRHDPYALTTTRVGCLQPEPTVRVHFPGEHWNFP